MCRSMCTSFFKRTAAVALVIVILQGLLSHFLITKHWSSESVSNRKRGGASTNFVANFKDLLVGRVEDFEVGCSQSASKKIVHSVASSISQSAEPHCSGWRGVDQTKKDVGLLVAVKAAPGSVERRQKLRERWAEQCVKGEQRFPASSSKLHGGDRVQCVFVVGHSKDDNVKRNLKSELAREGDGIVVAPMVDAYGVMTSKSVWILLWSLRTYCYRHLLFVDDDAHVFFTRLLPFLSAESRQFALYLGHAHYVLSGLKVSHCGPTERNKNCVEEKIYPRKYYHPFGSGFSYLLSRDVVEKALDMAVVKVSQPLSLPGNVEDAMIGHLAHEANVTFENHVGFVHWGLDFERCPRMDKHPSPVLVVGNAPDNVLQVLSKNEKNSRSLCSGL